MGDRLDEYKARIEFYSRSFENCYNFEISEDFRREGKPECIIRPFFDNMVPFNNSIGSCY